MINTTGALVYVTSREMGQYPLSIGTSMALESLMNIHPDLKHDHLPINDISQLWVNVKTMYRNLVGSMSRDDGDKCQVNDLVYGLNEDISNLFQWGQDNGHIDIVIYSSDYAHFDKKYPEALLKLPNTDLQKFQAEREVKVFNTFFKEKMFIKRNDKGNGNIFWFKDKVKPLSPTQSGMITHFPYDLTNDYAFDKLLLIESHTGAVKPKSKWYTKYYNGKKYQPLPFRLDLLQILGDGIQFRPWPMKIRNIILEIASNNRWTPMTTQDKMIKNISMYNDPLLTAKLVEIITKYNK